MNDVDNVSVDIVVVVVVANVINPESLKNVSNLSKYYSPSLG